MKITGNQSEHDYFVFNFDDELVRKSAKEGVHAKKSAFSLNGFVKKISTAARI